MPGIVLLHMMGKVIYRTDMIFYLIEFTPQLGKPKKNLFFVLYWITGLLENDVTKEQ